MNDVLAWFVSWVIVVYLQRFSELLVIRSKEGSKAKAFYRRLVGFMTITEAIVALGLCVAALAFVLEKVMSRLGVR